MRRYSNRAANYLLAHGVKRGDMVMVILKRHYQFWFTILALHKIGAVIIPATNLLTKKDVVYRVNAADVAAIVCTADGEVSQAVEEAEPEFSAPVKKFLVSVKRATLYSCSPSRERSRRQASSSRPSPHRAWAR